LLNFSFAELSFHKAMEVGVWEEKKGGGNINRISAEMEKLKAHIFWPF